MRRILVLAVISLFVGCLYITYPAYGETDDRETQYSHDHDHTHQLCGPVCVKIILKKHDIEITVKEAIKLTQATIDGTTMLGLKRAFEAKGLSAKGYRMSTNDLLALDSPAMLHVNNDHFLVVDGSANSSFIIIDYPKEPYLMSPEELSKIWDGTVLTVSAK